MLEEKNTQLYQVLNCYKTEILNKLIHLFLGLEQVIRPSITDKARTITHVCTSGTLCTTSVMEEVEGAPFGSYVDYILDTNGHPGIYIYTSLLIIIL